MIVEKLQDKVLYMHISENNVAVLMGFNLYKISKK